jgi:protein arginine N-methyltransferase 1
MNGEANDQPTNKTIFRFRAKKSLYFPSSFIIILFCCHFVCVFQSITVNHRLSYRHQLPTQPKRRRRTMATENNTSTTTSTADMFVNSVGEDDIPSFKGDEKAKASDFANYFCSYAQLYHQKQMLADHNRMAAYHSAILGNADVFKDKIVMDVGTGSGILAVWAAQAGARKVYAIEYTDMAKHARQVMKANGVDHIVTVIQGAVEDITLPIEEDQLESDSPEFPERVVDIFISEWMGYFLLRESMLDSLIRARDKFLKPSTGLMFPSHTTMYVAPVQDEEERRLNCNEYSAAMSDWADFQETTKQVYGVTMEILQNDFDREQKEYYLWSSRWRELPDEAVLAEPVAIKQLDMMNCTIEESKGIYAGDSMSSFVFDVNGTKVHGPISGLAGWFTADFKSRTDDVGKDTAPKILHPSFLSTGPENGYTHVSVTILALLFQ